MRADADHPGRVVFAPWAGLEALRTERVQLGGRALPPFSATLLDTPGGSMLDLTAWFAIGPEQPAACGIGVFGDEHSPLVNATIGLANGTSCTLRVGEHEGPFPLTTTSPVPLRVIVDHSVVEAFADGGRAVVTHRAYPGAGATRVYLLNLGATPCSMHAFDGYMLTKPATPSMEELVRRAGR